MNLTIDHGTIVLVTTILRAERGDPSVTVDEGAKAIFEAVKALRAEQKEAEK